MSVYIPNMEMPTNCWEDDCPCLNKQYGFCQADDDKGFVYSNKPEWCPLVPVQKHGRLIDADALMAKDRQIYRSDGAAIGRKRYIEYYEIDDAPTIIEGDQI